MAPAKKSGPASKGGNDLVTLLEGPISLLWAYQLRREHALLLSRVDSLADAVQNEDAAAQIKSLDLNLKAAGGRMTAVEKEVESHCLDLQAIRGRVSGGDEVLAEVHLQIVENEKQHKRKIECLEAEQKNMLTQIKHFKAANTMTSESELKEKQDQIRLLQDQMVELEGRLTELTEREVTLVKDSIEEIPPPNFRKPQLIHNSNVSKKINYSRPKAFSHANDLLQEIEEEEDSNMRNLHPFQREETASTEFDLDGGLATMSYARHLRGRRTPEEVMAMLPELPLPEKEQIQRADQHMDLRQGPTQSWDQYLMEGRDLIGSSRKRKEGSIVDFFVAGIADPVLRANCEHWLDNRVWIWENVESFLAHFKPLEASPEPSSTAEPTPRPQRTNGLGVRHGGTDSQAVRKELAKLLEDQGRCRVGSLDIAQSPEPDGNRRSQRIAKKNDTVSQQANGTQQTAPAKPRNQHLVMIREEPSQPPRNRRKQAAKDSKPPPAKSSETALARLKPMHTRATGLKQTVMPRKTEATGDTRDTTKTLKPATRTVHSQVENRDMQLENMLDPKLRAKVRKMHENFPRSTLNLCHEALVAKEGNYDAACQWVVDQTVQPRKPESMKDAVLLSTPSPVNRYRNAMHPAPLNAAAQRRDPYKTPEHRMFIGRTSYKRKLELSEQEQVANMKKARMAKSKRGPPPPIPILPSSDTE